MHFVTLRFALLVMLLATEGYSFPTFAKTETAPSGLDAQSR
ncbi:hypothetical protein ACF1BQ_030535 [Bradyrhizobium sp. RDT10]